MAEFDSADTQISPRVLQLIDNAFDQAIRESSDKSSPERPRKRQRLTVQSKPSAQGGFLLDEDNNAGGCIADDHNREGSDTASRYDSFTHIPLSLVPRALQILDLPPDDLEILNVLSNAACGWQCVEGAGVGEGVFKDEVVSRRDWRAVCAILLPIEDDLTAVAGIEDTRELSDISSLSSDPPDESRDGSSEDEYRPSQAGRAAPRRKEKTLGLNTKNVKVAETVIRFTSGSLTARQNREAQAMFALFFSDVLPDSEGNSSLSELSKQVITFKDVAKAANSIKERLKTEEITEMLTLFSSTSGSVKVSMTFSEFQEMLLIAGLI